MYERMCRSISWGILVSSACRVLWYVVICGGLLIRKDEPRLSPYTYIVFKHLQRLPPAIDRFGYAVVLRQGESSQVLKRIGSHGIATSNQDEKVSTNIRKRTSSFPRRISLRNASHSNTHTARRLDVFVSSSFPIFETATSLAECPTTSQLPNISFSCAYLLSLTSNLISRPSNPPRTQIYFCCKLSSFLHFMGSEILILSCHEHEAMCERIL
jgi:hypothetical protein